MFGAPALQQHATCSEHIQYNEPLRLMLQLLILRPRRYIGKAGGGRRRQYVRQALLEPTAVFSTC